MDKGGNPKGRRGKNLRFKKKGVRGGRKVSGGCLGGRMRKALV